MKWNTDSGGTGGRRLVVCAAVSAALALSAGLAPAQESGDASTDPLPMVGTESIDPNERISGQATIGINFFKEGDQFDPDAVWVYFEERPTGALKTQVTTVDGRYVFSASATPPSSPDLSGRWRRLQLSQEDGKKPLSTGFLRKNYDEDSEIAILVTDGANKAFPVRWGTGCATDYVRIRVNAEGANAYFVSFDNNEGKAEIRQCTKASSKTQFKFDHNCDMRLQDIEKLANLKIIRKRGATYEKPIPINISAPPDAPTANASRDCDQE